jgi:hypothetical protein
MRLKPCFNRGKYAPLVAMSHFANPFLVKLRRCAEISTAARVTGEAFLMFAMGVLHQFLGALVWRMVHELARLGLMLPTHRAGETHMTSGTHCDYCCRLRRCYRVREIETPQAGTLRVRRNVVVMACRRCVLRPGALLVGSEDGLERWIKARAHSLRHSQSQIS